MTDTTRADRVEDTEQADGSLDVSFPFREVEGLTGIGKQRQWLGSQAAALATDEPELKTDGGVGPSDDDTDHNDLGLQEHYKRVEERQQEEYEERHPDRPKWTDPNVCPECGVRAPELWVEWHLHDEHGWFVIRTDFVEEEPEENREPPGEQTTLFTDGGVDVVEQLREAVDELKDDLDGAGVDVDVHQEAPEFGDGYEIRLRTTTTFLNVTTMKALVDRGWAVEYHTVDDHGFQEHVWLVHTDLEGVN